MIGDGKCVLVVNEMEAMRRFLAEVLRLTGFTAVQACDGVQALCEMQERHVDVVVTDYHMPHLNGLDLLQQSQLAWPEIPIIFYSEIEWDVGYLTEAHGAFAWIRESIDPGILLSILALAVEPNVEWEFRHPTQWVAA
ncbi:MAG: response regulator [Nitrospirales bacterium]